MTVLMERLVFVVLIALLAGSGDSFFLSDWWLNRLCPRKAVMP